MITDPGLALPNLIKQMAQQQIEPLLKEIEALKQRVAVLEGTAKAPRQPAGFLSRLRGTDPRG